MIITIMSLSHPSNLNLDFSFRIAFDFQNITKEKKLVHIQHKKKSKYRKH